MMTMVMLSHPTPPVSELEAKQLSIMFSQILSSSCFAATPLRTNSTTACDDWQSQMPKTYVSMTAMTSYRGEAGRRTITSNNQELVVVAELMHDDVRISSYYLLLWCELRTLFEFKVANGAREGEVAIDPTKVDETAGRDNSGLFTCRGSTIHVSIQLHS